MFLEYFIVYLLDMFNNKVVFAIKNKTNFNNMDPP
jgi:hypothetical protein